LHAFIFSPCRSSLRSHPAGSLRRSNVPSPSTRRVVVGIPKRAAALLSVGTLAISLAFPFPFILGSYYPQLPVFLHKPSSSSPRIRFFSRSLVTSLPLFGRSLSSKAQPVSSFHPTAKGSLSPPFVPHTLDWLFTSEVKLVLFSPFSSSLSNFPPPPGSTEKIPLWTPSCGGRDFAFASLEVKLSIDLVENCLPGLDTARPQIRSPVLDGFCRGFDPSSRHSSLSVQLRPFFLLCAFFDDAGWNPTISCFVSTLTPQL